MFDLICPEARRLLWAKVRPGSTAAIQGNVGYEVAAVRAQKAALCQCRRFDDVRVTSAFPLIAAV
jgi:hypothetical protein